MAEGGRSSDVADTEAVISKSDNLQTESGNRMDAFDVLLERTRRYLRVFFFLQKSI